ncbi:putative RNA-directed DNA polymerase from mobile element jockey-like [Apostichopus japonicus]|uniref:Putative RNA-directed DNA polymerase from mobile element jockey-like n=1 Tax=Stichopus japonicus TaxID=307972 RepID=A0A2G8KBV8_STIJA|nr:putative RNA-directed DNA polymerase from mobile element jockey-like [Apostichopus japonicus]
MYVISDVNILYDTDSDHSAISCQIGISQPAAIRVTKTTRNLRDLAIPDFINDIGKSALANHLDRDLDTLALQYDNVLTSLLNHHAPRTTRSTTLRTNAPWYTDDLRQAKRVKRRCERKWLASGLEVHRQIFHEQCKTYRQMLTDAKRAHHQRCIADCDDRQLFRLVDKISYPDNTRSRILPDFTCAKTLANNFASFFDDKLKDLHGRIR